MVQVYDVCVVGLGPAGIFASLELSKKYKVLAIERGQKYALRHCKIFGTEKSCDGCAGECNIITGFGGAFCAVSGGTLSLYPAGSSLVKYYRSEAELLDDYREALENWKFFSNQKIYFSGSIDENEVLAFSKVVSESGGSYKHFNAYKICKEDLSQSVIAMENALEKKIDMRFCVQLVSVEKTDGVWKITCSDGNLYSAKAILFSTGRKGNSLISRLLDEIGLDHQKTSIEVGLRVELPAGKIDSLLKIHPDVKIKFRIQSEEVRTFCFCPDGRVIHFSQDDIGRTKSMDFLEGCIDSEPSGRTNIAFLHRINLGSISQVWNFQRRFEERYLAAGGKIIAQRFCDIGNNIFYPLPQTTTLRDYKIGSVFSVMPRDSLYVILEAIAKFNQMTNGQFVGDETIVCAPEFGNFWPEIKMDKNFLTNIEGAFVAGDALGFIRGALQASVTGLKVARGISLFLGQGG